MGTRNLTMVIHKGETKIAQYGQWDGYPSGQGLTALNFLKSMNRDTFERKLALIYFGGDKEEKERDEYFKSIGSPDGGLTMEQAKKYHKKYPMLTRDNGAEILNLVYKNDEKTWLTDSSDFAEDGLYCEWAYVIDLDKNTFEVYKGFNKKPMKKTERFYKSEPKDYNCKGVGNYYPARLVKKYKLDNLPDKDKFLKECEKKEK
jgi:hypothetical protein